LPGQQHECRFFGAFTHPDQLVVVGDDLFGHDQIGLQQGVRRPLRRHPRQTTHLAQALDKRTEVLMKGSMHNQNYWADSPLAGGSWSRHGLGEGVAPAGRASNHFSAGDGCCRTSLFG
jgi:hypothetical protein